MQVTSYSPILSKNTSNVKDYQGKIIPFSDANSLIPDCLKEMSSNGIPFDSSLQTDGKIHRFSIDTKKSQPDEWYVAHGGVSQRGNPYLICIYGSWSTGERYEYRSWQTDNSVIFSREDLEQVKREMELAQKKAVAEKLQRQHDTALQANSIWEEASKEPLTPDHKKYLEKKHIESIGDIRFGYFNNDMQKPSMILPLYSIDKQIKSLQFIWVDKEGMTHKRFLAGGQKKGCFMALKPIDQSEHVYVCEGYATGVSIQEVVPDVVMVAFDAGNLKPVIEVLKKSHPHKKITIVADNDDIGLQKAKLASSQYGCGVVFPDFTQIDNSHGMTDFNDLMAISGKEVVLSQLSHKPIKEVDLASILDNLDEDPCKDLSMEHFPPVLKSYIEGLSETTEAHPIMIIMSVLCSISAMVGKKVYMPKGEYFQDLYPNIWSLCINKSGGFKTTALNKGSRLAFEKDKKILELMEDLKNKEDPNFNLLEDNKKFSDQLRSQLRAESLKRPILPTRTSTELLSLVKSGSGLAICRSNTTSISSRFSHISMMWIFSHMNTERRTVGTISSESLLLLSMEFQRSIGLKNT